jgi:ribonuclease HI
MAEAAALSFAGTIISAMQIQEVSFLTDSQQMVHFFNGTDLTYSSLLT